MRSTIAAFKVILPWNLPENCFVNLRSNHVTLLRDLMAFLLRSFAASLTLIFSGMMLGQTFSRSYGSASVDDGAQVVIASPDGNMLVGGYRADSALVMKLDPVGNILWSRTFKPESAYANVVYHLEITPDGYLIGNGNAIGGSPAIPRVSFYFKMDLFGDLIWTSRSIDTDPVWTSRTLARNSAEYINLTQIYLFSGTHSDVMTSRTDALTGLLTGQSSKLDFFPSDSYIEDLYSGVIHNGASVYGCGRTYINGSLQGSMRPFISKFTPLGTHLWTKYFLSNVNTQMRVYGIDIVSNDDSLTVCCFGDINGSSSNFSVQMIRMDTLGNVAWAKDYNIPSYSSEISISAVSTADGYAIGGYAISGSTNDAFTFKISKSGSFLWGRSFGQGNGTNENTRVTCTKNLVEIGSDLVLTVRSGNASGYNILLVRMDENGNVTCLPSSPLSVTTTSLSNFSTYVSPTPISDPITIIQGPTASNDPVVTDGCTSIALELGNDTVICDSLLLIASVPGAQYLWQDGSTGPDLLATTPGTYWVTASIGCCAVVDTIHLDGGPLPAADFEFEQSTQDPFTVDFVNTSSNYTDATWYIGNTSATGDSVSFTFQDYGHYVVCLVVSNACGADTTCQQVDVFPALGIEVPLASSLPWVYTNGLGLVTSLPHDGPWTVSLYDMKGSLLLTRQLTKGSSTIELSQLAPSVYMVVASDQHGGCHTGKAAWILR